MAKSKKAIGVKKPAGVSKRQGKLEADQQGNFDVAAFIQEQSLGIDADVKLLLHSVTPTNEKKKKHLVQEEEEEEVISGDDLEEEELKAYLEIVKPEESQIASKQLVQHIYANKTDAILSRLNDMKASDTFPWIDTQCITSTTQDSIPDIHQDLQRELVFYKQALQAAVEGRKCILEANVPFSRPSDYFAEMVKDDEHMARVRQRLLDEAQSIKLSEQARRQRDNKKYGKQMQTEKLLERQRLKKAALDKIQVARKKSASKMNAADDNDLFDVATVDNADERPKSKGKKPSKHGVKSRAHRDGKYGFGGRKKGSKNNTLDSINDISGFNPKKGSKKNGVSKKSSQHRHGNSKR